MVSNSPVSEHSATREPRANGEQWESAHTPATHPATRVVGQQTLSAQVPTALMGAGKSSAPVTPTKRLKRVSSKSTPPESRASKGLKALSFLSPGTTTKAEPATGVTHPTYSTDTDTDPITPRQLEKELRLKWAQRLVSLLAPFADKIPNMASVMSPHQEREWLDLLGDTRFRTLRIHCLALENLHTTGFTQIPWTESDVREHLNRMRVEEASPHKIQRAWETLRWFSKGFGFLRIDACERLMEKKKALQEEGVDTVAKPQRKAILPTKEVIWTLEEVAAGSGQTRAGSGENMSAHAILDQYICGVVRFQVA